MNVTEQIEELSKSLEQSKEHIINNNKLIKKTYILMQDIKKDGERNKKLQIMAIFLLNGIYTMLQSRHDLHKRSYHNDPNNNVTRELMELMLKPE